MTSGSVTFVFSDVIAKLAMADWTVGQVLVVRGSIAVLLTMGIVLARGELVNIASLGRLPVLMRGLTEGTVTLLFMSALVMMPIADLTSILMLSPLVITALATLFFGEQVGWRRWTAIVVGFFGLLLVVQPGAARALSPDYGFAAMLGLISVFGVAARDLLTRKLGNSISATLLMVTTSLGSLGAGLVLSAYTPWKEFQIAPLLYCILAAVMVSFGNFMIILAFRGTDLSVVAPYRYSGVIWSILLGALVFGEWPNGLAVTGMLVIVASGIYLMHRERIRQQELAQSTKARP